MTASALSGVIALDQAAAFPSISRSYIWWVLKSMRVPIGIIRVLKSLYRNCIGYIKLGGKIYDTIQINSGVKQGDPSSMVLFILAYDPILRWISSRISPYESTLFGLVWYVRRFGHLHL